MPGENEFVYAPEYVAARAVLLDALDALDGHLSTIIVVGAQAVCLHTGAGDFVEAPMTTDGDLALNAELLKTSPEITAAMAAAGFNQGANPGRWTGRGEVAVDIMVAPFQSGRTAKDARSARLIGHGKWSARTTAGLEPALIDNDPHILHALESDDHRWVQVNGAGPAALLVAKIIKFEERLNDIKAEGKRVKQKDALDMLRLLQAVDTDDLTAGFRLHVADSHARDVSIRALGFLEKEGTSATSALPQAAAAVDGGNPTTAPSFAALAQDLLGRVRDDLGVTP